MRQPVPETLGAVFARPPERAGLWQLLAAHLRPEPSRWWSDGPYRPRWSSRGIRIGDRDIGAQRCTVYISGKPETDDEQH